MKPKKPTATIKSHDHYANQRTVQHIPVKPSTSTSKSSGITPPGISSTPPGTTGRPKNPFNRGTKGVRQAEEATSPDADTSNGG